VVPRKVWSPPAIVDDPAIFPEGVEVLVFSSEGGPSLVGRDRAGQPGQ
jgi:hypothetical protein